MWIDLRGTVLNAGLHRVNLEAVALIESGRLYRPSVTRLESATRMPRQRERAAHG
jgi:hypothetical protein